MATGQPSFLQNLEKKASKTGLGLIKQSPAAQKAPDNSQELVEHMREMSRRVRTIEERYNGLRKNTQITEHNTLGHNKKLKDEMSILTSEIDDLKKEIDLINERSDIIIKELKESAKKDDVAVLEKYISLWEPVNFVSRNEVEKIVRRILNEEKDNTE